MDKEVFMKRKLILAVWAILLVCLLGIAVYADTVPLPEDYKCEMYYGEDGTRYFPYSCYFHPHLPKIGDVFFEKDGKTYSVVNYIQPDYSEDGKIIGHYVGAEVFSVVD